MSHLTILEQVTNEEITAGESACHADGEADGDGKEAEQQHIDRMLLVVVVQRAQHCEQTNQTQTHQDCAPISVHAKKNPQKMGGSCGLTDEGQDDEEDVERDPGVGGDEELGDGGHLDDEAGDDGRHG